MPATSCPPACRPAPPRPEAELGDDGVEGLDRAGDEGMQSGKIVGLDLGDPLVEALALAVVHQAGEGADVVGGAAKGGAAGQDRLELLGLVVGEAVGTAGEPVGHIPHGRNRAGQDGWVARTQLGYVALHDVLATGAAALVYLLD